MNSPTLLSPHPSALRVLSTLLEHGWTTCSDLMAKEDVSQTDLADLSRYKYVKARIKGTRNAVDLHRDFKLAVDMLDDIEADLRVAGRRVACSPEQRLRTPFLTRSPHRLADLLKVSDATIDMVKKLMVDRQISCQLHAIGLDPDSLDHFDPKAVIVYLTERGRRYLPRT